MVEILDNELADVVRNTGAGTKKQAVSITVGECKRGDDFRPRVWNKM